MRSFERPTGFQYESNDCTVRALAAVTEIPYVEAHDIMKKLGRVDRRGVRGYSSIVDKALKAANVNFIRIPLEKKGIKTPISLIKQYPTSRLLCTHRGHAFAIKAGKILDNTGKRVHLHDAWLIIKSPINYKHEV